MGGRVGGAGPAPPRHPYGDAWAACGLTRGAPSARPSVQTAPFRAARPQAGACGPRRNPPAAWRGVVRARLPSWVIFHSAPQAGGRSRPAPPRWRRDRKAQSARRGGRRLRLSAGRWARMRLPVRPHAAPAPSPARLCPRRRGLNCFNPPGQRAAHNHAASGNASSLATIASMRSKSASISSQGCGSRSWSAGDGGRGIPRRTRLMRVAPPCGWRSCEGGTSRS